jgi:anthranilate synthase/aminodeoxychorismate synthase-like glutamine amidotransferase
MNVLFVDNIDSFVYNLVQYVGELGGNPVVCKNTVPQGGVDKLIKREKISGIIISPGPKTPKEAGVSNYLIKKYGPSMPILGVCLGHQCIGHVYGGKIVHAKNLLHGKVSVIKHDGSGVFRGVKSPLTATRYHSLVVAKKGLPKELRITAESVGDGEIMGIAHKMYPTFGVQFHPESILTGEGHKIMRNFLDIVGGRGR